MVGEGFLVCVVGVASSGVGWEWLLGLCGGSGFLVCVVGVASSGVRWEWLLGPCGRSDGSRVWLPGLEVVLEAWLE